MNTHIRSTRECSFGNLKPELAVAIRKHTKKYELGNIESSLLICCETTSTNPKSGLFASGVEITVTNVFVTPQLLLWTEEKTKSKPLVRSAWLRNIEVQDYENTAMHQVNPDSGMNITGRYTDVTKQGQSFIGLGADSAGEKFRRVLQLAIQKVQT